ncbi:MAG: FtsX-like permease family protein [Micromonosporaceae bacterium]|nr:FtsX-like permease family protein [Micromonosporaceae bacterium]
MRLRTLGLSQRAARGLLIWEIAPQLAAALAAGTALGAAMPWLLGPALGLERFSGGVASRIVMDPLTLSALAVTVIAAAAAAVVAEAVANRRLNLGGVLRVGDDE